MSSLASSDLLETAGLLDWLNERVVGTVYISLVELEDDGGTSIGRIIFDPDVGRFFFHGD